MVMAAAVQVAVTAGVPIVALAMDTVGLPTRVAVTQAGIAVRHRLAAMTMVVVAAICRRGGETTHRIIPLCYRPLHHQALHRVRHRRRFHHLLHHMKP